MKKASTIAALCLIVCYGNGSAQTRVACIGNSITYGYGLGDTTKRYPSVLRTLLGTAQYAVQNDGVNSTTMLRQGNVPYWTNGKLADVFAFQPDIVTVMLGTNDTKAVNWGIFGVYFERDYGAFIDTLNTLASKPKIFLALPAPIFANTFGIRDSILTNFIIPVITRVGAGRGLGVIDANTPLRGAGAMFPDGVHPNRTGADSIARIFYRAIQASVRVTAFPVFTEENIISKDAVPVFNGCTAGALFDGLKPGRAVEFRVFDARGVLTDRFTAEASASSCSYARKKLVAAPGIRWVTVDVHVH
jgi:acyl-CoA thioesterase-1